MRLLKFVGPFGVVVCKINLCPYWPRCKSQDETKSGKMYNSRCHINNEAPAEVGSLKKEDSIFVLLLLPHMVSPFALFTLKVSEFCAV